MALRWTKVRLLVNCERGAIDEVVQMPETIAEYYVEADRAEYVDEGATDGRKKSHAEKHA